MMECNKEEGIRARDIAEKKMLNKDFAGAQKVALKARQLYPDIDNISQMLTVCEVHCSAGVKFGSDPDWYGILQVEPTADETLIRKQYRKLALLLHPDKNKFPGAEAAFKLIGEANRILSDREKRSVHNLKRNVKITVPSRQSSQQMNRTVYVHKQPKPANEKAPNITTKTCPAGLNQQHPSASSAAQTFWTYCPSCSMRYEYYRSLLNKTLRCQNCLKPFVAYDLNAQPAPPGLNSSHYGAQTKDVSSQNAHDAAQQNNSGNATFKKGPETKIDGKSTASETWSKSRVSEVGSECADNRKDGKTNGGETCNEVKFEKVELNDINRRKQAAKPSAGNSNRKRGRKMVVESSDTDGADGEDAVPGEGYRTSGQEGGANGNHLRRSARQKQKVAYNEEESGDDLDGPSSVKPRNYKRLRKGGVTFNTDECEKAFSEGVSKEAKRNEEKGAHVNTRVNKNETRPEVDRAGKREEILKSGSGPSVVTDVDFISKSLPDLENLSYPDPEFYDFENKRDINLFAAGQIWALYDDLDGMPRYYAQIRYVYRTPNFTVKFTWLEHAPASDAEIAWSNAKLPFACGSYRFGGSETTQDRNVFSHLMPWEKGSRRSTYDIHPRKGEVWALFKDWDISWSSCVGNPKKYQFEVVEVLSDPAESTGIDVVRLVRIKGFVSLFMRASENGAAQLRIPPGEMLRLSHMVPFYRLNGNEREGIPKGSFELDPASLPINCGDTAPSISLGGVDKSKVLNQKNSVDPLNMSRDVHLEQVNRTGVMEVSQGVDAEGTTPSLQNTGSSQPSSSACFEYPDAEFHSFQDERTIDKFQCGQIWAVYSDADKYPKYYGQINKVVSEKIEVHMTWLESFPILEVEKRWFKEKFPIGCGMFRVGAETATFDSIDVFSHMVKATLSGRKDHYTIHPRIGEVWAVYKNWQPNWSDAEWVNCAFDVAEIIEQTRTGFRIQLLEKHATHKLVFMPGRKGSSKFVINVQEYLRFSHRIPAFKLTGEANGTLRGYWELDPASVPENL